MLSCPCYYGIHKPLRDQVFSKVLDFASGLFCASSMKISQMVVFPRYGMDGLDHGGIDYFVFTTYVF